MTECELMLSNIDFVKDFVNIAMSKSYDIELLSGKYIVNAKSIMGVFSLDLTKPVIMRAHCENDGLLFSQIEKYKYIPHK